MAPSLFAQLEARFAPETCALSESFGMPVLEIEAAALLETVGRLRTEFDFNMLLDVTAVDWPQEGLRFELVYHLLSTARRARVRVKTRVACDDAAIDSLVPLYGSALFMERECHDMYGIDFRGHPDLRPILLYEGFVGHPLRKDYDKHHEQPLVPLRR